jgi:hypothetical protein
MVDMARIIIKLRRLGKRRPTAYRGTANKDETGEK